MHSSSIFRISKSACLVGSSTLSCINSRVTRFLDCCSFPSLSIAYHNTLSHTTVIPHLIPPTCASQPSLPSWAFWLFSRLQPERLARIGNVLRVSLFVQNLPTSVATRRRVVSVAPKSPSQHRALVPAFREWVSKMEITAR